MSEKPLVTTIVRLGLSYTKTAKAKLQLDEHHPSHHLLRPCPCRAHLSRPAPDAPLPDKLATDIVRPDPPARGLVQALRHAHPQLGLVAAHEFAQKCQLSRLLAFSHHHRQACTREELSSPQPRKRRRRPATPPRLRARCRRRRRHAALRESPAPERLPSGRRFVG